MNTDALFSEIRQLIPTLDGWCTPDRAVHLASLVIKARPEWSVCLGIWGGRDTFAMAMAHRHIGMGKCMAIDPYRAAASVVGQESKADVDWWSNQEMHDVVMARFLANVSRLGLDDWIAFQRTTAAGAIPPPEMGVLVVDGNHGPDSIADVEKWAPRVSKKGYAYMDDCQWSGGFVLKAVDRLKEFGFEEMFKQDTGAFFHRV